MTSIIRFAIFFNVKALLFDGTFISAELVIWSLVEPGIYLIAACLPTLRPLFLELITKFRGPKSISKGSRTTEGISLEWRERRGHAQISDEDSILNR